MKTSPLFIISVHFSKTSLFNNLCDPLFILAQAIFEIQIFKNLLFLFEIDHHVSKCDFGPLFNDSNLRFKSRFEIKIWPKIAFSKWVHQVRMNSFKHYPGVQNLDKKNTPRSIKKELLYITQKFTMENPSFVFLNWSESKLWVKPYNIYIFVWN